MYLTRIKAKTHPKCNCVSKANSKQAKLTTIKAQTAENKARLDEANHSSGSSRRQIIRIMTANQTAAAEDKDAYEHYD
jgi:hypothetical protein